jgi:uncharacterized tellurite resistance protein B-like protein
MRGTMQFLLAIIGLMGVIGVILYRMNQAAEATRDATEAVRDLGHMARRWGWRSKFAKDSLEFVTDPREAAVAALVAMAQADGALTERERTLILEQTQKITGGTVEQAEQMLAHARWSVRDVRDVNKCLGKLAPVLRNGCSPEQRADIVDMLNEIVRADGLLPSRDSTDAIARLRQKLA